MHVRAENTSRIYLFSGRAMSAHDGLTLQPCLSGYLHAMNTEVGTRSGTWVPLFVLLAVTTAAIAIGLMIIGRGTEALAALGLGLFLGLVALAVGGLMRTVASGDTSHAEGNADESVPTLLEDEEVPLGASAEVHGEITNVDLPREHLQQIERAQRAERG